MRQIEILQQRLSERTNRWEEKEVTLNRSIAELEGEKKTAVERATALDEKCNQMVSSKSWLALKILNFLTEAEINFCRRAAFD